VALVVPAATVTLAGTAATVGLALLRLTTAPPVGAALVSVTEPCDELPPTTEVEATLTADRLAAGGGGGAACAVKRRTAENGPATPEELMARTRQKSRWAGRPLMVACDAVTVWLENPGRGGTSTIGGPRAAERLLVASVTDAPPASALAFRNTVPLTLLPPVTPATLSITEVSASAAFGSGPTLMNVDFVTPP